MRSSATRTAAFTAGAFLLSVGLSSCSKFDLGQEFKINVGESKDGPNGMKVSFKDAQEVQTQRVQSILPLPNCARSVLGTFSIVLGDKKADFELICSGENNIFDNQFKFQFVNADKVGDEFQATLKIMVIK